MKTLKAILVLALLGGLGAVGFVYSGLYPIGADTPHDAFTYRVLETLRERSIARASADLKVPALDDPAMLLAGGADYNDMCATCHLKPGKATSDMAQGLYPKPPNLSRPAPQPLASTTDPAERTAARQFWIIKHGIKASAMPAWGPTHDDARIWAMVAFLQKLPTLTADQYQILTARDDGEAMDHGAMDMGKPASAADAEAPSSPVATDSANEPTSVVERFQKALAAGDTAGAADLLDPAVKIFESGGIERSKTEYAAHHLISDAAFLKTAKLALQSRTGDAVGDLAWVGSESRITASVKDKPVDLISTETMVLKKTLQGWRIVHIHWSSRPYTSS